MCIGVESKNVLFFLGCLHKVKTFIIWFNDSRNLKIITYTGTLPVSGHFSLGSVVSLNHEAMGGKVGGCILYNVEPLVGGYHFGCSL